MKIETRDYQTRIIQKALDYTKSDNKSVLIESPTGSGKSIMGLLICKHLQEKHGYSVGWSAMRRNLLSQVQRENEDKGINVDMQVISMFDKNPPKTDILVVDEAQHDSTTSMSFIHSRVAPEIIIGLTATPYRTDRMGLCFDKVIKDCGIHQLIHDGHLSQYHHYTIDVFSPQQVARVYLESPDKWGKSVMFFHRQEQCDQVKELLTNGGVKAEVVTATSDRDTQLQAFEDGDVDVLINMMILAEGFDSPNLKTVFVRPSVKGCTVQMAGRVFRKHKGTPYKQIVQCMKTKYPFPRHAKPQEQWKLEGGVWRSLIMNSKIEKIAAQSLKLISQAKVEFDPSSLKGLRKKLSFNDFNDED